MGPLFQILAVEGGIQSRGRLSEGGNLFNDLKCLFIYLFIDLCSSWHSQSGSNERRPKLEETSSHKPRKRLHAIIYTAMVPSAYCSSRNTARCEVRETNLHTNQSGRKYNENLFSAFCFLRLITTISCNTLKFTEYSPFTAYIRLFCRPYFLPNFHLPREARKSRLRFSKFRIFALWCHKSDCYASL